MKFLNYIIRHLYLIRPLIHLMNYLLITTFYILRPLLGPSQCRFSLSCGNYAIKQLKEQSLVPAITAICKRLWQCTPWGPIEPSL